LRGGVRNAGACALRNLVGEQDRAWPRPGDRQTADRGKPPGGLSDTLSGVPSLFHRKPSNAVADVLDPEETGPGAEDEVASGPRPAGARKAYTPSKREQGKLTPKRPASGARRVEPPPANRREAYRRLRDKERAERAERRQAMLDGDERYLLARDRGPERELVRDIVDSRRTVGTWFFAGALIVLFGSQPAMPLQIRFAANLLWMLLMLATILDSVLISRRIGKLVRERFPNTTQRFSGLYFYGIVRGLTFRRLRMPRPKVKVGHRP
jgi:hypothetical protein